MMSINAEDLTEPFTLCFFIRVDTSVLNARKSAVRLISFADQIGTTLTFYLQENTLQVRYVDSANEVLLLLCAKALSAQWIHHLIQFNNEAGAVGPTITLCRDIERVPDVGFVPMKFQPGPLSVTFGGFVGNHQIETEGELGQIAQILLYNRCLV
jgi:hypothetical protein